MKKLIFLFILLHSLAYAENMVQYDPLDPVVPYRVIKYVSSGDQSQYLLDPNDLTTSVPGYLVGVDLSGVQGVNVNYWKVSESDVIEMSQAEKDALIAAKTAAAAQAEADRIILFDNLIYTTKRSDAVLTKIDAEIDNISNLDDAKAYLKKIMRYFLND